MATASRPTGASTGNRATRRASTSKKGTSATKKPATEAKPTASVEDLKDSKPESAAHATLDELEAEAAELLEIPPFVLDTVGDGNEEDFITIGSPGDVPYAISSSNSLDAVFSYAMSEEDWNKFIDADLTTAQAGIVFLKWRQHYGIGTQGE